MIPSIIGLYKTYGARCVATLLYSVQPLYLGGLHFFLDHVPSNLGRSASMPCSYSLAGMGME